MKILCVIDSLGSGGAQRQLVNLAVCLKLRGHAVELFTYYPYKHFQCELEKAEITHHSCVKRNRFSLVPIYYLRKLLTAQNFDVVLAFLDTPSLYSEVALLGIKEVGLVVSERSASPDGKARWHDYIKSLFHLRADFVVANSECHTFWLMSKFPWLKRSLITIHNGVNLNLFKPKSMGRRDELCEERVARSLSLVAVGRISKAKNLLRLIEALKLVEDEGLDVVINWIGRDDDRELCVESKSLLKHLGVEKRWNWLGEIQNVSDVLCDYDALIIPSIWEGFPNAVCEAMACGLPVLGSRISDIPLLLGDSSRGFLFDPMDVRSIANSIMKLASLGDQEKKVMSNECRAFALEYLSEERAVSQYERVFDSLRSKGAV